MTKFSSNFEVSTAEEVSHPRKVRPQLILLGAGASRAAFPSGDANARRLPVMADFFSHVPITSQLDQAGIDWKGRNFEDVYSSLAADPMRHELRVEIESVIEEYFAAMRLPSTPTIFDYILLSLRQKDVIATFNWDPFLIQAYRRSLNVTKSLPYLIFLHGNVSHGFCERDQVSGLRGGSCSRCGEAFASDRLLFPVGQKNYSSHPSIAFAWDRMRVALKESLCFTIFGYGAPQSDKDAIGLMTAAWGPATERQFEEVEVIDIQEHDRVLKSWSAFIHTHHYSIHASYWDSFLANHPRRSVEAFHNQYIAARFIENNPAPRDIDLCALHSWFANLADAEENAGV